MKGIDNHIIQLFKKYFGKNASRLEMRKLEQESEDNPYLSEAMEGVDKLSMVDRETTISNLQTRLAKRTGKRESKIVPMQWLKLAAGIAILLSVGLFIWRPADTSNMAVSSVEDQPSTPKIEATDLIEPTQTADLESIASETDKNPFEIEGEQSADPAIAIEAEAKTMDNNSNIASQSADVAVQPPKPVSSNKNIAIADSPIEAEKARAENFDDLPIEDRLSSASDQEIMSEAAAPVMPEPAAKSSIDNSADMVGRSSNARAKASKKVKVTRQIRGTVYNQDGEPLIGVSVNEKNSENGTITDIDGSYSLDLTDDKDAIVYSYTGSDTKEVNLGDNDEINVTLQDDRIALEEVTVSGYGRSDDNNDFDQNSHAAVPAEGKSSFKKYIENNLVVPESAKQNNIKGKVTLLFDVNGAGRPYNIEVKKSLGYGCDEEAIRLLKEGPDWEQGTRDGKTKLVVKFR